MFVEALSVVSFLMIGFGFEMFGLWDGGDNPGLHYEVYSVFVLLAFFLACGAAYSSITALLEVRVQEPFLYFRWKLFVG